PLRSAALYEVEMEAQGVTTHSLPAMFTFRTGRGTVISEVLNRRFWNCALSCSLVPEAPDRPTVTMATATSVYLTWNPRANGGAPITHFHVQAIRLGRAGAVARHSDWYGDWHTVVDNVSPSKLSVEVTRLQPGVTYTFRVSAWNMYGESKRSKVSHPYTVQRSRRGPERPGPYIAYTEALSHEQILLNWMYTPNVNSTPIRGFYIFYRPTDSGSAEDYAIDVVASDVRWHQISELQAGTSYDIKMRTFSDGGESEDSNVMICETLAPQPPPATRFSEATQGLGSGGREGGGLGQNLLYVLLGLLLGPMALSVGCLAVLQQLKRNTDGKAYILYV
uniref:Fibronectin type-III domain-containing protein n=1 Tax=Eptatretus burgeri TaxID=7764 RepID=A0A8C4NC65_EPTBU